MRSIFAPINNFQLKYLPDKTKPNWKLVVPGALLVGLSIGAGEIIIWPRIVAPCVYVGFAISYIIWKFKR